VNLKYVAKGNAISKEDFTEIEKRVGGPSEAARIAGLNRVTWWKLKEGKRRLTPHMQKHITMMLQTIRMPLT